MSTIVVCSMLHESAHRNSATRRFRGEPVLAWTMRRLALTTQIERVVVLAWDDQLNDLSDIDVNARACGGRRDSQAMRSVAAARRWADGWRGGLLQSCWFDNGFAAELVRDAMNDELADAVVLVDPAAGLVDPHIVDDLATAGLAGTRDMYFTPAAPGLGGVLLKRPLVEKLAAERWMPGRLVHYLPDAPALDPITSDACVAVPLDASRTIGRFALDSDRQCRRVEAATVPLNGTLISTHAAAVAKRIASAPWRGPLPRDITLELTTRRHSRPIFSPAAHLQIDRPDVSLEHVEALAAELAGHDDTRVTLAGVGDPLLHANAIAIARRLSTVAAVSIETDLLGMSAEQVKELAAAGVDVVAVHLPARTPQTYARIMGVDRLAEAVDNIKRLIEARQRSGGGVPVVAPVFVKTVENFDEMEAWYDTWLRALGSAVITGPSTYGGRIADCGVADMTPPVRRACRRLDDRVTILSDGGIVACEQDPTGDMRLGRIGDDRLTDVWQGTLSRLNDRHKRLVAIPQLCSNCNEWHRP